MMKGKDAGSLHQREECWEHDERKGLWEPLSPSEEMMLGLPVRKRCAGWETPQSELLPLRAQGWFYLSMEFLFSNLRSPRVDLERFMA